LEKRQEGQKFRLVDPPTLPVTPTSPKRLKISLGGAAAGMLLGLALAFLVDIKDRSFHAEEEAVEYLKLPLVAIPLLPTQAEIKSRNLTAGLEWAAGSVMVLAVLAVEYYVYLHH
jgi:succinoglycan biosynthesis transport protein ExoP